MTTSALTRYYRLNVITDDTGEGHKIDPDGICMTSLFSDEMVRKNESQFHNAPEYYLPGSMVTVTDFPNFSIQRYETGPVTQYIVFPVKIIGGVRDINTPVNRDARAFEAPTSWLSGH